MTPLSHDKLRERLTSANWIRAHVSVVALCVIVTLAVAYTIVVALTSVRRASEAAIEREKQLVVRAIANYGEHSLRKLRSVIFGDEAGPPSAAFSVDQLQRRVEFGFDALRDHDAILVAGDDRLLYSPIGRGSSGPQWTRAAFPELVPVLDYLRAGGLVPAKTIWLTDRARLLDGAHVKEAAFLHALGDRLAIVSGIVSGGGDAAPSNDKPPVALALLFVGEAALAEIGDQLQLVRLRRVSDEIVPAEDYAFTLVDEHDQSVARFAWTPQRAGLDLAHRFVPLIALALISFVLLAALIWRYLRRSAAAMSESEDRTRFLALHDPLSGLPNRGFFRERLEATIAEVRQGRPPIAVFYIDLDHFKDVNDTLGHPIGDELIRNVAQRLSRTLRGDDFLARLGGDEFAIITTATFEQTALEAIARRLITTLCAPYAIEGHTVVIGASIGIVLVDQHTDHDVTDVMRYADMALYRAKSEGRNRACIYDATMETDLSNRKRLEQSLREAIEDQRLHVLYQPIVNSSGEKIVGVEALARWSDAERGYVSPSDFIPLAEHSGLIVELGRHVLRQACNDGKAWPELVVAVNVSPIQFRQVDFVEMVERILSETGFDPKRLDLELTESMLIGNVEAAETAMVQLKALGVQLSLDDFGTGYSSLQYLRRFPFDKLKIDRSFVHRIEKGADAAAIVSLGRGLGMKVTAEGVETAEQHLFLRAAGVHSLQGYYFGQPCTAGEITAYLARPGAYRSLPRDRLAAIAG